MRRTSWLLLLLLGLVAGTPGCGRPKAVLYVYTWSDYIDPAVVTQFEAQFDCRVVIDNFDSNEAMYAKLKAGASGYDLVMPSSYMVSIMHKQGMLQPLRHEKIPNLKYVDRGFLKLTEDTEMHHSVPYMCSATGIGYDRTKVPDLDLSWAVFARADLGGRMTMLGDMREAIGAALKYLGFSLNTTSEEELAQARDLLIGWKKNLAKFEVDEAKRGLGSGEFLVVQAYNGDVIQVMQENPNIGFGFPREGTSLASDDMVIPVGAAQPDLAHAFIDFLHSPGGCARNMEYVSFLCPNLEGRKRLSEKLRTNPALFPDATVVAKSEVIRDLGEDNAKYTRVWDQVRSAE